MARVLIPTQLLHKNGALTDDAGVAVDVANGHAVAPARESRFFLEVSNTDVADHNVTIKAGDYFGAGAYSKDAGSLTVVAVAGKRTKIGPLESARFGQVGGLIQVDLAAGITGVIRAFEVPR